MKTIRLFLLISALLLMIALAGLGRSASAAGDLFVAPSGNDGNACTSPSTACKTINGALSKALSNDTIKVAIGTYTGSGEQVVTVDKNIFLSGGWNASFTVQSGMSVVDGGLARSGLYINNNIQVTIDHFTIQNSTTGIINNANVTITNVTVRDNRGARYCWGVGISNFKELKVRSSYIHHNICEYGGHGGGIFNLYSGTLTVENSLISNNQASTGAGIYSDNDIYIVNSTISNNVTTYGFSDSGGGGIYTSEGVAVIKNSTISGNEGTQFGGGIYHFNTYGGTITLENTILSGNTADIGADCNGPLTSQGYNIISSTAGCTISAVSGDRFNTNPRIGPLQDNGGPTMTHFLYANSPAVDGGNPAGCTDLHGNPLTSDQRGAPRPLDGDGNGSSVCDIGAFEADPNTLPPPPANSLWYVKRSGNNSSDCHTPATACATINGAIDKAISDDIIYISAETYTSPTGADVALVNKSLTLSGGWDAGFTSQIGFTTIDGQQARRGIMIADELSVDLERFNVQNGRVPATSPVGGGGIRVGTRSSVEIASSFVRWNEAPYNITGMEGASGGGISVGAYAYLTLTDTVVSYNTAERAGGGLAGDGTGGNAGLVLNHCTVSHNSAPDGGGIYGGAELYDSEVSYNTASMGSGKGGGIHSPNAPLVLSHSRVFANRASEGGGIFGFDQFTLTNSDVISNTATYGGGGIKNNHSETRLIHSAIFGNRVSDGNGGGVWNGGSLVLINSTIANNRATAPGMFQAQGGGVYAGIVEAYNATIVRNYADDIGGGIWSAGTTMTMKNTILAENQAATGPDCEGVISGVYTFIGNTSGCSAGSSPTNIINQNPRFSFWFGWPATLALQSNSPAVDAGDPAGCTDDDGALLTTDQVSGSRPIDGDGDSTSVCDMGAYEYNPDSVPQWILLPLVLK